MVELHRTGQGNPSDLAGLFGVGRSTVYRPCSAPPSRARRRPAAPLPARPPRPQRTDRADAVQTRAGAAGARAATVGRPAAARAGRGAVDSGGPRRTGPAAHGAALADPLPRWRPGRAGPTGQVRSVGAPAARRAGAPGRGPGAAPTRPSVATVARGGSAGRRRARLADAGLQHRVRDRHRPGPAAGDAGARRPDRAARPVRAGVPPAVRPAEPDLAGRPHRAGPAGAGRRRRPRRAAARSSGSSAPSPPSCCPSCPGSSSTATQSRRRGVRCPRRTPPSAGGSPAPTTSA